MVRWFRWHCPPDTVLIRNSSPGGLRPSTLPLGHGGSPQYWLSHVDGKETLFVSFQPPRPGTDPRTLAWKAAVLTTTLGPPPLPGNAELRPIWCRASFAVDGGPAPKQGLDIFNTIIYMYNKKKYINYIFLRHSVWRNPRICRAELPGLESPKRKGGHVIPNYEGPLQIYAK